MTKDAEIIRLKAIIEELKHDYLTGLEQRGAFELSLQQHFDSNEPFILVMCDVNNLHSINREFGYAAGDSLIRRVAEDLRNSFSQYGQFYKAGGSDEFFGILSVDAIDKCKNDIPDAECAYVLSTEFGHQSLMMDEVDRRVTLKKASNKNRRKGDRL